MPLGYSIPSTLHWNSCSVRQPKSFGNHDYNGHDAPRQCEPTRTSDEFHEGNLLVSVTLYRDPPTIGSPSLRLLILYLLAALNSIPAPGFVRPLFSYRSLGSSIGHGLTMDKVSSPLDGRGDRIEDSTSGPRRRRRLCRYHPGQEHVTGRNGDLS